MIFDDFISKVSISLLTKIIIQYIQENFNMFKSAIRTNRFDKMLKEYESELEAEYEKRNIEYFTKQYPINLQNDFQYKENSILFEIQSFRINTQTHSIEIKLKIHNTNIFDVKLEQIKLSLYNGRIYIYSGKDETSGYIINARSFIQESISKSLNEPEFEKILSLDNYKTKQNIFPFMFTLDIESAIIINNVKYLIKYSNNHSIASYYTN